VAGRIAIVALAVCLLAGAWACSSLGTGNATGSARGDGGCAAAGAQLCARGCACVAEAGPTDAGPDGDADANPFPCVLVENFGDGGQGSSGFASLAECLSYFETFVCTPSANADFSQCVSDIPQAACRLRANQFGVDYPPSCAPH
jgi:hypothetical protein